MIRFAATILFCTLTVACNSQDPRKARVSVYDEAGLLQPATEAAIDFWKEAGPGQFDLEVANNCDADEYHCIFVNWADVPGYGECNWREDLSFDGITKTSSILIDIGIADDKLRTLRIVAHELGHAFGLPHVALDKEWADLMYNLAGPFLTEPTIANWYFLYHEPLNKIRLP